MTYFREVRYAPSDLPGSRDLQWLTLDAKELLRYSSHTSIDDNTYHTQEECDTLWVQDDE